MLNWPLRPDVQFQLGSPCPPVIECQSIASATGWPAALVGSAACCQPTT